MLKITGKPDNKIFLQHNYFHWTFGNWH